MTIVGLLAQDLLQWMDAAQEGVPPRVLLWLDPERQFRRLAQHLEPAVLARGGGFLWRRSGTHAMCERP